MTDGALVIDGEEYPDAELAHDAPDGRLWRLDTGEYVAEHDAVAAVTLISEGNALFPVVDDAFGDGATCRFCGETFDSDAALGGHTKSCDERPADDE